MHVACRDLTPIRFQIVKVIGTHTPFDTDASCDENNPLNLTITCVLKGKIDNTGNEREDMLYYTEDEDRNDIHFWDGQQYHLNNDNLCHNPERRRSHWIEMLDVVDIIPELWNSDYFGDLDYDWSLYRQAPEQINTGDWDWQNQWSFTEPGTYMFDIWVRNFIEIVEIEHDIQDTISPPYLIEREYKVKSWPSVLPEGVTEAIDDWYMVHIKGQEDDPYDWARSFLSVPFMNLEGIPGRLIPNDQITNLFPVDYHYIDCAGLIHAAEWLNGWEQYKRYVHQYITNTQYSSALGSMNSNVDINAQRNDWVGIDPKTASGGFDGNWGHIIMVKEYEWRDWHQPGNEQYEITFGHKYDFIHAYGGNRPGEEREVREDDQFFFPIILEPDPQNLLWNIWFRRPNRQL